MQQLRLEPALDSALVQKTSPASMRAAIEWRSTRGTGCEMQSRLAAEATAVCTECS